MKRIALLAPLVVALCLLVIPWTSLSKEPTVPALENAFVPDCPPPFPDVSPRPVDVSCGIEGVFDGNATDAHRAQNRAKNSFCAKGSNGTVGADPILTTITTYDILQQKVEEAGIDFGGSDNLPADRDALKNIAPNVDGVTIGEGSYVVFVGFMLDAHRTSKESVSCKNGTVGFVDIHITLARSKNADLCNSIGAEIIPHFRPSTWPRIYYKEHYEEIKRHPLRLKGHLFFDGSHHPCGDPNMTDRDPLRRSDWEIHPVYSIDVCSNTTLASCGVSTESVWTPFDQWIVSQ